MRISDLKNLFTNAYSGYATLANGRKVYQLTGATSDGTSTAAATGSLGIGAHTTGLGKIFISDGSVWRPLSGEAFTQLGLATVAATGNTDGYITAPITGKLAVAVFTGIDALAQHGSNYLTFSITNLGQTGAGSTAMLDATDANTTKTTTGTALAANTPRALTVHSTGANLLTTKYDRLRFRAAATGTLANTVTVPTVFLIFERAV